MPILALAGGTSLTLGRAIVTSVLALPDASEWHILILSRNCHAPNWLQALSPPAESFSHPRIAIKAVDYLSYSSLVSALQNVHTLISLLFSIDGKQATREINLLNAAVEAGVKRFAPTAWGLPGLYWDGTDGDEGGILAGLNRGVWEACNEAMRSGSIQCAKFNLGVFMNYLAWGVFDSVASKVEPTVEELRVGSGYAAGIDAATEGVGPQGDMSDGSGSFLISLQGGIAEVPVKDDGSYPQVTMTTVRDVGNFVAASMSLEGWEEDMGIVGETIDLGRLIETAENVSGKTFELRKCTKAELVDRWNVIKWDKEKYVQALWLQFKILYCDNLEGRGWLRPVVNTLCPRVKTLSVRHFLKRCRSEG